MEDNRYNEWYSQKSVYDWYAPNFEAPAKEEAAPPAPIPAAAAPKAKKPRRRRTGLKLAIIVVCVLVLVSATALYFSDGFADGSPQLSLPSPTPAQPSDTPEGNDFSDLFPGFDGLIPDSGDGQIIIPGENGEMPENFKDFFDSYFTMEDSIAPSNITRAEAAGDFKLELNSFEGLEKLSLQELYAGCSPSVVGVMANYDDSTGYGWGTGVIIDESGYIVTNAHVISEADSCTVVLSDGSEHNALLVGEDAQTDLAVLKIKALNLVPATFGDSNALVVGDDVVAIGNPLGAEFSGTLTNGIVSAINRSVDYSGTSMTLIQTNAALNEGNSGGPLINMYGQIIGITNMKMANEYGIAIEGIGFAIPSTTVKTVVDSIIENGKVVGRPGIGITCGSVPQAAMDEYGLPEGLYITDVSEGSDAKAKGILPGDVLTHINGQAVYTTDDVLSIRDEHKVGDTLVFTIFRNGESFEVNVEIYDLGNIYR